MAWGVLLSGETLGGHAHAWALPSASKATATAHRAFLPLSALYHRKHLNETTWLMDEACE